MKMTEYYLGLRDWLAVELTTASLSLENEPDDSLRAVIFPVSDISYMRDEYSNISLKFSQAIAAYKNYDRRLKYHEIPLGEVQGLYQNVAIGLVSRYTDIHPGIFEASVGRTMNPIDVSRTEDENNVWQIQYQWVATFQAYATPEDGDVVSEYVFNEISLGIFREAIDESTSVKDVDLVITS